MLRQRRSVKKASSHPTIMNAYIIKCTTKKKNCDSIIPIDGM